MGLFRKRRYYFSDSSIASDTVIAFIMGGIALFFEVLGIIASIVTKGNVSSIFAILYLCAIVLSISGEIFAWIGNKAQAGSVTGKRISILFNILTFIIPLVIIFI